MSASTKHVVVELFGPARELAGVPEVELVVEATATVRDVLRVLAAAHPRLAGRVIDGHDWTLGPHLLLSLDGSATIEEYDMQPGSGARLLVMSALTGGT